MKRFILPAAPNSDGVIRLYEKDYHYLVRVRRLRKGSCFDAILPGGGETRVRILSTVDNILIGECLEYAAARKAADAPHGGGEARPAEGAAMPPIVLFQGLPRGSKMDLIVRQAAETGVSAVVPFETEYSTARGDSDSAARMKRWERIVREARQQSGSVIETRIRPPCGFKAALDYWESIKNEYKRPLGILLHQEYLEIGSLHGYLDNMPDVAALAVGPEGGFSPGEVSSLIAAGWKPAVLGNTILRTETAALYATAAIRVILLENETWTTKRTE